MNDEKRMLVEFEHQTNRIYCKLTLINYYVINLKKKS